MYQSQGWQRGKQQGPFASLFRSCEFIDTEGIRNEVPQGPQAHTIDGRFDHRPRCRLRGWGICGRNDHGQRHRQQLALEQEGQGQHAQGEGPQQEVPREPRRHRWGQRSQRSQRRCRAAGQRRCRSERHQRNERHQRIATEPTVRTAATSSDRSSSSRRRYQPGDIGGQNGWTNAGTTTLPLPPSPISRLRPHTDSERRHCVSRMRSLRVTSTRRTRRRCRPSRRDRQPPCRRHADQLRGDVQDRHDQVDRAVRPFDVGESYRRRDSHELPAVRGPGRRRSRDLR